MKYYKVFNEQVFFYINKKRKTWGTMVNNPQGRPSEEALSLLLRVEIDDIVLIAVVSEEHITSEIKKLLIDRTDSIAKEMFNVKEKKRSWEK